MKRNIVSALLTQLLLMSSLSLLWAQQDAGANQYPPGDNTKVNQRDQSQN